MLAKKAFPAKKRVNGTFAQGQGSESKREGGRGWSGGGDIYIYIDKASSYLVHIQAKTSFDWPII